MGRRIETAVQVEELAFQLPDGREYIFALDMAALAAIEEEHGNALKYLEGLGRAFSEKPVSTLNEILYLGIRSRCPDVTRERIAQEIPPTEAVISAITETLTRMLPAGGAANPTTPGRSTPPRTTRRNHAGSTRRMR
jgi:hypothetical protein